MLAFFFRSCLLCFDFSEKLHTEGGKPADISLSPFKSPINSHYASKSAYLWNTRDSEHTHTRLLKCAYSPSDSLSSEASALSLSSLRLGLVEVSGGSEE